MTNSQAARVHHAGPSVTADDFLWPHQAAPAHFNSSRVIESTEIFGDVIDVTPVAQNEYLAPAGMFSQWPIEVLERITKPFTGLVVLIDLVTNHRRPAHKESLFQAVTGFVAGVLGENDFGCRTTDDEFVMICPGVRGSEAQRRLNQISEQLWEFQQRGNGAFSLVFSWGGIGVSEKPLSEAMAAAVQRMNHLNQNRIRFSKESVNHRRKVV